LNDFDTLLDASLFSQAEFEYHNDFTNLLSSIYSSYENMTHNESSLPRNENKIRDILVDKYLKKEINDYEFKKEEDNNLGRVDIYIIDTLDNSKPHFIIECKILDDKNTNGVEGKNSEYIKNGIQRLLTEHYYIKNSFYTNAMIGFIIEDINIENNNESINILVTKLLNNLITVISPIALEKNNIYKSIYKTGNDKEFIIYHLMMDFSKNIK
jgi:hypothetical protein